MRLKGLRIWMLRLWFWASCSMSYGLNLCLLDLCLGFLTWLMMIIEGIEFWVATPERRRGVTGARERGREGEVSGRRREVWLLFVWRLFCVCFIWGKFYSRM